MAELADAHGSGPCGSNTMRVQVPFSALIRIRTEASSPCPYSIGSRMLLNPRVHGLIRLAPDSVGAKHAPPEHNTPFSALSICTYLTTAVNMAEMPINTYFFYPTHRSSTFEHTSQKSSFSGSPAVKNVVNL